MRLVAVVCLAGCLVALLALRAAFWVCRGCPFLWTYKNIACAQNLAEAKPPIQIWFGYVFQLLMWRDGALGTVWQGGRLKVLAFSMMYTARQALK